MVLASFFFLSTGQDGAGRTEKVCLLPTLNISVRMLDLSSPRLRSLSWPCLLDQVFDGRGKVYAHGADMVRRRIKISHDPRNLSWSQSSSSFGQRLMTKHGWKEGQSLGNRESNHVGLSDADRLAAARVGVLFKDDNLGLGAKRKSKDVEAQRTGLDAFQGLLGRLNGKSDAELKEQEKKTEDRKLEMYVRGRWGGMVFVRGGVLVGDRQEEKTACKGIEKQKDTEHTEDDGQKQAQSSVTADEKESQKRREEKRRRKEERRLRREEKALRKAAKQAKQAAQESHNKEDEDSDVDAQASTQAVPVHAYRSPLTQPPDEPVSSASSTSEAEADSSTRKKGKRRRSSGTSHDQTDAATQPQKSKAGDMGVVQQQQSSAKGQHAAAKLSLNLKNGRHLLRGRNIQAKKMVFSDLKGLDEIFMRPG